MMKIMSVQTENIVKGESAAYKNFLLFPQCFQKTFSLVP